MTPHVLLGYFGAASTVAGTLTGLLFVAINVRYHAILSPQAPGRHRAVATSAFVALTDALTISLWALMRGGGLGYATTAMAGWCLFATIGTHMGPEGRRDTSGRLFILSIALYVVQVGVGIALIVNPDQPGLVYYLAYMVVAAILAALSRSWQLLQVEGEADRDAPPVGGI